MDFDNLDFGTFDFEDTMFNSIKIETSRKETDILDDASTSTVDGNTPETLSGDDGAAFDFTSPTLSAMDAFSSYNWDDFANTNFTPLDQTEFHFDSSVKKPNAPKISKTDKSRPAKKRSMVFDSLTAASSPVQKKPRKQCLKQDNKSKIFAKSKPVKPVKHKAPVVKKVPQPCPRKKKKGSVCSIVNKDDGVPRIGVYTLSERKALLERFKEKRLRRIFRKKIKYDCRKVLAQARPRVRGRFVKVEDMPRYLECLKTNQLNLFEPTPKRT